MVRSVRVNRPVAFFLLSARWPEVVCGIRSRADRRRRSGVSCFVSLPVAKNDMWCAEG